MKLEIVIVEKTTVLHSVVVEAASKEEVEQVIDFIGPISDIGDAKYQLNRYLTITEVNEAYDTSSEETNFAFVEEVKEEDNDGQAS